MEQELGIKEIHNATLEIVKKIAKICDEMNINYFVMYGSLIGAIRHKGFIPWDDDFDIAMLRPDYDKFVEYCEKNSVSLYPFKLLNRNNCKNYPYAISRMNDFRYRAVYDNIIPYDSGLFVDIYPFDGYGDDPQVAVKRMGKRKTCLMYLIDWAIREKFQSPQRGGVLAYIARRICFNITHILGKDYFLELFEKLTEIFPYSESNYVGIVCWEKRVIPYDKKFFEDYLLVPFENIQVKIPIGYKEILELSYGDYMKLPPENERVASHEYKLYRR